MRKMHGQTTLKFCVVYPVLMFSNSKCVISDSFFGNLLGSNSGCMKDIKDI
jgi:hypothetical protein